MRITCDNVQHMSRMIQIRNVPDDLHRALKVRAAERGLSLSDLLLAEIEEVAERPSLAELAERLSAAAAIELPESPADAVRRDRDER